MKALFKNVCAGITKHMGIVKRPGITACEAVTTLGLEEEGKEWSADVGKSCKRRRGITNQEL